MVPEVTSIIMTSYLFVRELLVLVDVDLLEDVWRHGAVSGVHELYLEHERRIGRDGVT